MLSTTQHHSARTFDPRTNALLAGPLAASGGVTILPSFPDAYTTHALTQEAWEVYANADRQECDEQLHTEGRGGIPARALTSAGAGPAQDLFYASQHAGHTITSLCGTPMKPSGGRGTYSYYVQPGDFLDLHLDIVTCDATLITVLYDSSDADDPSGSLVAYPQHMGALLRDVRRAPDVGAFRAQACAGDSILILGGLIPHKVWPLSGRGQRVISALCFEAC